jgi:hypothetical protein
MPYFFFEIKIEGDINMETEIINYTPHAINLIEDDSVTLTIPKTGLVVRAVRESIVDRKIAVKGNEFEVRKVRFSEPILVDTLDGNKELPLPIVQEGVVMAVSAIAGTALMLAGRTDFLIVDGTVRNDDGQIIGATGFADMSE